ncbi:MAG: hemolysin III family protein [Planctomycetales bacterium]|nr:hemolysin III family protein [Planctomycetales bacterium]
MSDVCQGANVVSQDDCFDASDLSIDVAAERLNFLTHGLGFVLSVLAAVTLSATVASQTDGWRMAGCFIYAASLVSLYAASTLSHCFHEPRRRRWYRMLDQGCIYLLIAGTYTPFGMAFYREGWGLMLLAAMWSLALAGCASKLLFAHRVDGVAIWIYLALGWLPIVSAPAVMQAVSVTALWWMLYGGLCYTLGTWFLMKDHRAVHYHAIWHLFVIAGSAWHFFAIYQFVAKTAV